jgi:hypothetical protein
VRIKKEEKRGEVERGGGERGEEVEKKGVEIIKLNHRNRE